MFILSTESYIERHFTEVLECDEFYSLTQDQVAQLIASDTITVPNEEKVVIFVADVKEVETVEIEETEERGEFHSGIGVKPMEKPGISSSIMNNFFDKTKYFYK